MTAATAPESWRLGHRPALDGLRGIAVLLVIASHFDTPNMLGGGEAGVLIFFVLSGFLITSLLLGERDRTGRIDLWAFYLRRARRLLPALALVLSVTLVAAAWLGELANVGPQAFRAALYHANTAPVIEPLGHAWTLSVEEQFYIVWPAIVIGLTFLSSRLVAVFAMAVAVLVLPVDYNPSAFGAIAAGSALGAMRPKALPSWLAIPAFATVLLAAMIPFGPFVYVWVRLAVVAAALVLVLVALRPVSLLSMPWLRWIGRVSYGLYLWHVPVRWVLTETGFNPLLGIPIAFVVAAASWYGLERRFLVRGEATAPTNATSRSADGSPTDKKKFHPSPPP